MTENNLFSPVQHGFVAGKSCCTQLLEVMEDLTEALDNGKDVDMVYLDFCKAFDKVPHRRLLTKVWGYGIRGKVYIWIKEFLSNRVQKVMVNGKGSDTAKVTSGIPQGSVLGPILFLIFINDLPEVIQASIKLFADDAKIYQIVSSEEDINQFQENINRAVNWSKTWQMFYNTAKCKHLHVGSHDQNQEYTMTTSEEPISTTITKVDREKDLGVVVDKSLKFTEHIDSKIKLANRNLGLIFRTFTFLDKEIFLNLYKSLVRPHLEYAATVWSPVYKKDKIAIENVQRRATKLVKNISHMSYSERLKILGLPSLEYRRERADVIQVYKILHEIDKIDKEKLFTVARYTSTRGHSLKLYKYRSRLNVRANSFSNRVVEPWNSLPESIVQAPSLNCFKSRLNKWWSDHPYKFTPACYDPGKPTRDYYTRKRPEEAEMPE
ncbi:MAG: reverse transcriptase family protein [Candidatus Thiodiazotropha sp.]